MEQESYPFEPLTDEWVQWLRTTLADNQIDDTVAITIEHCVTDTERPDFWWHVRLAGGRVKVASCRADNNDPNLVTFTSDRDTALAVILGDESIQAAFLKGNLRLQGDVRLLLTARSALETLKIPTSPTKPQPVPTRKP